MLPKLVLLLLALCISGNSVYAEEAFVASVNGAGITRKDLNDEIDRLLPQVSYHGNVSAERRAELQEQALDGLIERELQHQDARARGLKADEKKIQKRLEQVKESFASSREFKAALEQAGITEQQLVARFRKEELVNVAVEKSVVEPSKIDDAGLKDHYDRNRDKYKQPESVRIRIISTRDEKKAAALLVKLKNGEDFGAVAAANSEDKYRVKGGDIGIIHRGSVYPELEKAAFGLKPGGMSEVIRAEGQYYILRVDEKSAEHQVTFEDIKNKLRIELERKRSTDLREQWISSLKAKAKIEINIKSN